jgi:hypothetical protein
MRSRNVMISKIGERKLRFIPATTLAVSLGMLALGGCSSQNADVPPSNPVAVNFALDKCEQLDANLYKCPAVDQPICTPQFVRTDINCIRVGPKGSIFVQRGGANP